MEGDRLTVQDGLSRRGVFGSGEVGVVAGSANPVGGRRHERSQRLEDIALASQPDSTFLPKRTVAGVPFARRVVTAQDVQRQAAERHVRLVCRRGEAGGHEVGQRELRTLATGVVNDNQRRLRVGLRVDDRVERRVEPRGLRRVGIDPLSVVEQRAVHHALGRIHHGYDRRRIDANCVGVRVAVGGRVDITRQVEAHRGALLAVVDDRLGQGYPPARVAVRRQLHGVAVRQLERTARDVAQLVDELGLDVVVHRAMEDVQREAVQLLVSALEAESNRAHQHVLRRPVDHMDRLLSDGGQHKHGEGGRGGRLNAAVVVRGGVVVVRDHHGDLGRLDVDRHLGRGQVDHDRGRFLAARKEVETRDQDQQKPVHGFLQARMYQCAIQTLVSDTNLHRQGNVLIRLFPLPVNPSSHLHVIFPYKKT